MLDEVKLKDKFSNWYNTVSRMHPTYQFEKNTEIPWSPLKRELSESRVALLSTAGVHLKEQQPYDVMDPEGDYTFREIPNYINSTQITVSHTHYNTEPAKKDINVVFPIDRLRELKDEGIIGEVSDVHYGMMGYMLNGYKVKNELGPLIAEKMLKQNVEVVVLTPG
jgi:D-proline reductase (dithiol) PrdB